MVCKSLHKVTHSPRLHLPLVLPNNGYFNLTEFLGPEKIKLAAKMSAVILLIQFIKPGCMGLLSQGFSLHQDYAPQACLSTTLTVENSFLGKRCLTFHMKIFVCELLPRVCEMVGIEGSITQTDLQVEYLNLHLLSCKRLEPLL